MNSERQIFPGPGAGPAVSRRSFVLLTGATGAAALVGGAPVASAAPARPAPPGPLTTAQSLGVNATGYDRRMTDAEIPGLLRQAGIGLIRYPGGGNADGFDWRTDGPFTWPLFVQLDQQVGAAPLITVNYGQTALGPAVAADWAADAVRRPGWDSRTALWVLGNEGYGPWEIDEHPDSHTPQSYAQHAREYFEAIHRADRSARVGFPMTIDRDVAAGTGTWVPDPDRWNRTVLSANRDQVDWIDFHWYPVFGVPVLSNAQIFETVRRIPGAMRYLAGVIAESGSRAPVFVSESNISQSEIVYNAQPVAALYAAATALTFLSHGAHSFLWWQVHNTDDMNGDFGFLSDGTGSPGPSATTLSAPARAGDRQLRVTSTDGFHYGHRFTIGSGAGQESRKITAIGGGTVLSAPAAAGSRTIHVGAVVPFAPGTEITIGSEATAERGTVKTVGTGAGAAALAAPAAPGDRTLYIVGEGMGGQSIPVFMPISLAPGAQVVVGSGADAETVTVASVGTSSSLATTTVAPVSPGEKTVYVAETANTNTGVAHYVGDLMTVGDGVRGESGVIVAVGTAAAAPTTVATGTRAGDGSVRLAQSANITLGHAIQLGTGAATERVTVRAVGTDGTLYLTTPQRFAHAAGTAARDLGTGITLDRALRQPHPAGSAARDAGSGLRLTAPVRRRHAGGDQVMTEGTGVTLSGPLTRSHATGEPASSSGITFTPPLSAAHPEGTPVNETGLREPPPNTPMPAFWGYVLTSELTRPGARITALDSPLSSVLAFGSTRPGTTAVMLINTDDAAAVTASVAGLASSGPVRTLRYGLTGPVITESATSLAEVRRGLALASESITVLVAASTQDGQALTLRATEAS
ncbi:hypothetical protein LWP59_12915 [Amycolatopsis acidiphila]|uniref:Alpha-L-arabinofuranosidase n=1 Tax=Amycolatopsis acidiphila TaxID=715473 RepID=A0A558AM46_9PSEU|nr:hypothetical protein [Amycolatopsis acidiphila]TVT25329.1 hypothetical protein FNH06_03405 [Amycolatopsis acidiphila]UIJ62455.1 hypothetical protein LWP59_12915 [Amycolatopsis acidiphila]GHG83775.1 hypothetical protein GCM10017788_55170 [Amycolatopsis acidiphila]